MFPDELHATIADAAKAHGFSGAVRVADDPGNRRLDPFKVRCRVAEPAEPAFHPRFLASPGAYGLGARFIPPLGP